MKINFSINTQNRVSDNQIILSILLITIIFCRYSRNESQFIDSCINRKHYAIMTEYLQIVTLLANYKMNRKRDLG